MGKTSCWSHQSASPSCVESLPLSSLCLNVSTAFSLHNLLVEAEPRKMSCFPFLRRARGRIIPDSFYLPAFYPGLCPLINPFACTWFLIMPKLSCVWSDLTSSQCTVDFSSWLFLLPRDLFNLNFPVNFSWKVQSLIVIKKPYYCLLSHCHITFFFFFNKEKFDSINK